MLGSRRQPPRSVQAMMQVGCMWVESNAQTVHLGVFDTTLPPFLTIESGDAISFPNTWSHFLNQLQPGVPVDTLAALRKSNPGRGPHSIIGPIAVNKAEPGDVLEI